MWIARIKWETKNNIYENKDLRLNELKEKEIEALSLVWEKEDHYYFI